MIAKTAAPLLMRIGTTLMAAMILAACAAAPSPSASSTLPPLPQGERKVSRESPDATSLTAV